MIFSGQQQTQTDTGVIVPAHGYFELRVKVSGKPVSMPVIRTEATKIPVIAFRIIGDIREAITVNIAPPATDEIRSLLLPTGAIIDSNGEYFKDAEVWSFKIFNDWRKRWTEEQQRKAAAA